MKSWFLFCSLFVAVFSSCLKGSGGGSFEIKGVAPMVESSKYIYLYTFREGVFTLADSALIRNGLFSFGGHMDSDRIGLLSIKHSACMPLLFVLENSALKATIDTTSFVSGTPLNDHFQQYINEISPIELRLNRLSQSLLSRYDGGPISSIVYDSVTDILSREEDLLRRYTTDFVAENNDNIAGAYIFAQNSFLYTNDMQTQIIEKAGREFRNEYSVDWIFRLLSFNRRPDLRAPYLDLPFELPDGKAVALSDYLNQDRFLLLLFWDAQAQNYDQLLSEVVAVQKKYRDSPFLPLMIALNADDNDWRTEVGRHSIPEIQLRALNENVSNLLLQYVVKSVPYVVLLNRDGVLVAEAVSLSEIDNIMKATFK